MILSTTLPRASNRRRTNATRAQNSSQGVRALPRGEFFPRVKRSAPSHPHSPAGSGPPWPPRKAPALVVPPPSQPPTPGRAGGLTFVAGGPGLVAVVAGDTEDPLLDGGEPHGSAGEVLHGARPLQVFFDGLVHHQVLQLPQLRADVGQPPGADIGGAPHTAGGRERGVSGDGGVLGVGGVGGVGSAAAGAAALRRPEAKLAAGPPPAAPGATNFPRRPPPERPPGAGDAAG